MKLRAAFILFLMMLVCGNMHAQTTPHALAGAWESIDSDTRIVMICSEKFFSVAVYNLKEKKFISAYGGSYAMTDEEFVETQEFNTVHPEFIGKQKTSSLRIKNDKLLFTDRKEHKQWSRIDDGSPGKLSGAWLITGRMQGDSMSKITPGARRTMKILSGTRFQWIAYNVETKEFSGTGGGTYSSEGGKYVENIEFFSRDSNRVGQSLQFDFSFENGNWRHKGLSSKGDPIDEVWTKRETLGL